MLIRKLQDIDASDARVETENWYSRRLLLKKDKMGFSVHDTVIKAETETPMWYQNHLEAVYCIEGEGDIEDLATGERHALSPGVLYALDQHDRHILRAKTQMRMVCVFNPPVTGREIHDENGAYPADETEVLERREHV